MSEQTPLFVDTDGVYGADEMGLPFRDLMGEGVVESGDLAVSQRAAGANMSVDVAAGACWIKGDTDSNLQPTYRCRNDATVNRSISAADPTDARIDLVIARVNDSAFTGSTKGFSIEIVEGTAAPSPSDPAIPDTAFALARVNVAAAASSITTADLDDLRPLAMIGGIAKPFRSAYKAADTSRTSDTSLTVDPDLALANIGPGEVWAFHGVLFVNAGTAPDIAVEIDGPTGSTGQWSILGAGTAETTGPSNAITLRADPAAIGSSLLRGGQGAEAYLTFSGVLDNTNGDSGGLDVLWGQVNSSATATIVKAYSYIVAERIA